MPWKETCVHQERMKFVVAWKQGAGPSRIFARNLGSAELRVTNI